LGIKTSNNHFPDHHYFQSSELVFNNDWPVIMTEKDAVKCADLVSENAWYLEIQAIPNQAFISQFEKRIEKLV